MVPSKRLDYLDNLKVFLTILVIFHHAGQAYGLGGDWGYTPSNPAEYAGWLWRFFSVNAAFFMGLFFLISGYFVPQSFDRQGFGTFVWKKFLRLGIPTLFMVGTIFLLTKQPDVAHTWFLEHLFFYSLIYAVIRCVTKKIIRKPKKAQPTLITLFIIAACLSVADYFITRVSPQDKWIWILGFFKAEPAHLAQYVLMFALGVVAYRQDWLNRMPKCVGLTSLILGILIAFGYYFSGPYPAFQYIWVDSYKFITEAFLCISISFGILWLFREVFHRSGKFMKWCADQSFGAYFVHVLLMIGIQNIFDKLFLGGGTEKFLFIGIISVVLSYVLAWLLRLIPGMKKVL